MTGPSHAASQAPSSVPPPTAGTILGHPPGLFLLFFTEMWERFSYYGMRALLVIYLTSVFALNELPAGVYSDKVEFAEVIKDDAVIAQAVARGVSNEEASLRGALTVPIHAVIGDAGTTKMDSEIKSRGAPTLQLQRLQQADDPDKPGEKMWVPATDAGAELAIRAPVGGPVAAAPIAFRLINATPEDIECRIRVLRPEGTTRTYFTINDKPDVVSLKVRSDANRKPDEKPIDIVIAPSKYSTGRNWLKSDASNLYGWYTGLAYLLPILGGIIADRLIGTHRSMLIGGLIIALGHIVLGLSGIGELAHNATGMTTFVFGLALIVLGTGHFKPTVSVMVGQLYDRDDPRRDTAYTIFYMGINVGAFICAFVCGTLGEWAGWHWGFAAAAVGMLLGLVTYMWGRPYFLKNVGLPPAGVPNLSPLFFITSIVLSLLAAGAFHIGWMGRFGDAIDSGLGNPYIAAVLLGVLLAASIWFVAIQEQPDRGPTACILIFILFNAVFWIAFEQAGSSLNLFATENTDLRLPLINWPMPATWFQSFNPFFIIVLAPIFALMWGALGKRGLNPSQPVKIALALLLVGGGYLFMVAGARAFHVSGAKVSMLWLTMTYLLHTFGELCISPTGLAFVTRAAPQRYVSFLMGLWFLSSFVAGKGGGQLASYTDRIESGEMKLFWYPWFQLGGQADFFLLFVISAGLAGVLILAMSPFLKAALHGRE